MKLDVNAFQAMKANLLTNLGCISFFPLLTLKVVLPVPVPVSPLPSPATFPQEHLPGAWTRQE